MILLLLLLLLLLLENKNWENLKILLIQLSIFSLLLLLWQVVNKLVIVGTIKSKCKLSISVDLSSLKLLLLLLLILHKSAVFLEKRKEVIASSQRIETSSVVPRCSVVVVDVVEVSVRMSTEVLRSNSKVRNSSRLCCC